MLFFNRITNASSRAKQPGSNIALAIALMTGSALGVTAFADVAVAQKRDRNADKAPKADYSKEFVAVYKPLSELASGDAADPAAAALKIPELLASLKTPDDSMTAGGLIYGIGRNLDDSAMELQGLTMMLDSGKHPAPGQLNFNIHQIHRDAGDYAKARAALQAAIDLDYSFEGSLSDGSKRLFTTSDLQVMLSELYFDEEDYQGGFAYLQNLIDRTVAAGSKPDESWIRRAFSVANSNDQVEAALNFTYQHVQYYPSTLSWSNALAVLRNTVDMDENATLDVMRLVNRTGAMKTSRDYVDYIDAADARRLPGEVSVIVAQGIAAGVLETNDAFVNDAQSTASSRLGDDKKELPTLEADARKADSTAVTATAAGDVFLGYGTFDKAEEMYKIAATRPGADLNRVYTRLGIVQADQGKIEEAKASFAKITGQRVPIARLWSLYAEGKAAPAASETATDAPAM